jgi:hypothetical protein
MTTLRKYGMFAALLLTAAVAVTATASATTYPYTLYRWQEIDTHQGGWINIAIDPDGRGSVTHSWSNGKQISGNDFYSVVVLRSKEGKVIWSDKQVKGIDGSWFGSAREDHVTTRFTLSKEQMDAFDHVDFRAGTTYCGLDLTGIHFVDNGIEIKLGTCKEHVPSAPRPERFLKSQQM